MTVPPGDEPGAARASGTVLYIDDNTTNLRLVSRIFERAGDVVLVPAMLGGHGLELARKRPDLILLDLNLPDMSGEEVLARLRADPLTRDIPVVVMSAETARGVAERLADLGVEAFVSKPIEIAGFLAVAARFLPRQPAAGDGGS